MRLDDVRGFVFDVDGTLVHRAGDEVRVIPGAREILERIHESGRPYAFFTNGSHMPPEAFARELRTAGLPVADDQLLTPLCSVQAYLERLRGDATVLPFLTDPARAYLEEAGVHLVDGDDGARVDAVFVAREPGGLRPARVCGPSRDGRGAAPHRQLRSGVRRRRRPDPEPGRDDHRRDREGERWAAVVVGKPSHAAVRELRRRLGVPSEQMAVVGDDLFLDIALGHLGRSRTVLVRTGISGSLDLNRVPERRRPHLTIETVAELLDLL